MIFKICSMRIRWALFLTMAAFVAIANAECTYAQKKNAKTNSITTGTIIKDGKHYIPLEALDLLIHSDKKGVFLSQAEYKSLKEQSERNSKTKLATPRQSFFSKVEYLAEPAGDQLKISATFTLKQFREGWQTIALPFRHLSVESATLDGQNAHLGKDPKSGKLMLLNREAGEHQLVFQLVTPLHAASSDKVAAVGFPQVPEGTFSLRLPQGKHLVVNDALVERANPVDQPTTYRLPVGGQNEIVLRITDRMAGHLSDPLVFLNTELSHQVRVGEVLWNANSHLQVFGQPLDTLQFRVPKTLEITNVTAIGLESWELEDDADDDERFAISLRFRNAFQGTREIKLFGVLNPGEDDDWSIPVLNLKGVTNHIGTVKIEIPQGIQLQIDEQDGLRSIPTVSQTGRPSSTRSWNYAFWRDDFSMDLMTSSRERQVISEQLTSLTIDEEKSQLEFHTTVTAYQSQLFELDVLLPAEWTIEKITLNNNPANWRTIPQQAGIHSLKIRSLSGAKPKKNPGSATAVKTQLLDLKIFASRTLEKLRSGNTSEEINLPEIRIVQANAVEGAILVQAAPEFLLEIKDLKGLDAASLKKAENVFGYRYRDSRISGLLSIMTKPSRLSAETMNYVRLDANRLETFFVSSLEIRGTGKPSLDVLLPQSLGNQLQFQLLQSNVRITEQEIVSTTAGNNLWRLRFDKKLKGHIRLVVRGSVSKPTDVATESERTLPRVVFPNAIRQTGYVVIEGMPQQHLNVTANYGSGTTAKKTKSKSQPQQPLESVLPIDLPAVPANGGQAVYSMKDRIVSAYRFLEPNYVIRVQENRFLFTGVPTAVCNKSQIVSLLSETATIQHEANYTLLMSGIAEVRFELPPNTRLWAALWNKKPVEVRESGNSFSVVTPSNLTANRAVSLTVFYSSQPEEGLFSQRIEETPPRLFAYAADGSLHPFPVLEQEWIVRHPSDYRLVSSSGEFAPGRSLDSSIFTQLMDTYVESPSAGRMFWSIAILISLLLIGGLVFFSKRNANFAKQMGVLALVSVVLVGIFFIFISTFSGKKSDVFTSKADKLASDGGRQFKGSLDGSYFATEQEESARSENSQRMSASPGPESANAAAGGTKRPSNQPQADASPDDKANKSVDLGGIRIPVLSPGLIDGAVLSVPIQMVIPDGNLQESFRYSGNKTESENQPKLSFTYRRESSVQTAILLIVAGSMFLFWMLRNRSLNFRAKFFASSFCASLALQPVIFTSWKPLLEGLILGLIAGVAVWVVNSSFLAFLKQFSLKQIASKATTAALLFLACAFCMDSVSVSSTLWAGTSRLPSPRPSLEGSRDSNGGNWEQQVKPQVRKTDDRVVIPYDPKTDPFKAERIYLPQQEFLDLWNRANPDKKVLPASPLESVTAAVLVDGKLAADSQNGTTGKVSFHARLVIYSYRDSQVLVPIPLKGIAIRKATLDGKSAPLVGNKSRGKKTAANTTMNVIINSAGLHLLDLEFDVPARLTQSSGSFSLELLPIAAGRMSFELPSGDTKAEAVGAARTFRIQQQGNRRLLEFPLDQKGTLRVSWQPPQQQADIQRVVRSTANTKLEVSDRGLIRKTHLDISVRLGALMDLSFAIPAHERLQKISGPDLAGWEMSDQNGQRTVKVFMRRPVEAKTSLDIELFRPLEIEDDAASIGLKQLAPKESAHSVETVGILAENFFAVSVGQTNAVRQIGIETLQKNAFYRVAKHSLRMAYRMTSGDASLQLSINRRNGELAAFGYNAVSIDRRKLRIASLWTLKLERRPLNRIEMLLPEEFLLLNVQATGLTDWSLSEDKTILYLDFGISGMQQTQVSILGLLNREDGMGAVDLSIPIPIDANRMETQLGVWFSPGLAGTVDSSEDWRSVPPESLHANIRSRRRTLPAFAFRSSDAEIFPVSMKVSRQSPTVTADSATIVTVQENSLDYHLLLKWHVKTAGLQNFVFSTSKWLADKLEFDRYSVQKMEHPTEPDTRVLWVVRTSEKLTGDIAIVGTASLPALIGKNLDILSPFVEFENSIDFVPTEALKPLDIQTHFVVLTNNSRNQLSAVEGVESRLRLTAKQFQDSVKNSLSIPKEILDSSIEILRLVPGGTLPHWSAQRFVTRETSQAIVNLADLTTVLEWDGSWRTKAVYHIKNRAKQFLALHLPEGARILSVHVKQRAAKPVSIQRDGKTIYLVPLPKVSAAEFSVPLKVILAGELPEGLPRDRGISSEEIAIPVPQVVEEIASEFGIPVTQTRWRVYLPEGLSASQLDDASRSNMTRVTKEEYELMEEIESLNQANEMFSVLQEKGKFQQQSTAMDNIQKIQQKISGKQTYKDKFFKGLSEQNDLQRRLANEREKFDRNLKGVKDQLDLKTSDLRSQLEELTNREIKLRSQRENWSQDRTKSLSIGNNRFSSPAEMSQQQEQSFQFPVPEYKPSTSGRQSRTRSQSGQQQNFRKSLETRRGQAGERLEKKLLEQQDRNSQMQRDKESPMKEDNEKNSNFKKFTPLQDPAKQKKGGIGGAGFLAGDLIDGKIIGQTSPDWSGSTGLALDFEIPTQGQLLTFSKITGEPKLVLKMRSQTKTSEWYGWVWFAFWGVTGFFLIRSMKKIDPLEVLQRSTSYVLILAGIAGVFLLKEPFNTIGFVLILFGVFDYFKTRQKELKTLSDPKS